MSVFKHYRIKYITSRLFEIITGKKEAVMIKIILFGLLSILIIFIYVSCDSLMEEIGGVGHKEEIGGVGHATGYEYPVQNCTECHGSDLKGDDDAPSCFSCHDQNW
jgi:hypothetical protein